MSAKPLFLKLIPCLSFVLVTVEASAQFRGIRPPSVDEQLLLPPIADLSTSSQFGNSVAIDGNTAVVGAHRAPARVALNTVLQWSSPARRAIGR